MTEVKPAVAIPLRARQCSPNRMTKTLSSEPGNDAKAPSKDESFSLISDEKLLTIYAALLRCCRLEQRTLALFQQGKLEAGICTSSEHLASAAAIITDLQPADAISIASGDWLPAFVKGLSLDSLFRALAPATAQRTGIQPLTPSEAEMKNVLLASNISQQAEAVDECAAAAQAGKTGAIIVAFAPQAPKSAKPWQMLMTSAAFRKLPIIFVDHTSPLHCVTKNRKSGNIEALFHGVPVIAVDANDAVALYRVAHEASLRARRGRGTTLIQCISEANVNAVHCNNEPQSEWTSIPDPVSVMENYLRQRGIEMESHFSQIVAEFNRDLDLATRFLQE